MHIQLNHHPLQQTFTHIHQLNQYIGARFGTPAEPDWLTPAELLAPQSPALVAQIEAMQKRLHTKAVNTIGGALIQEYQWPLISAAVGCFLVDRRVPDLHPENIRLYMPAAELEEKEGGHSARIAFSGGRFSALPTDPAADHPDAYIVADQDALRDDLRTGLEAHFGWVIEKLSQAVGCNPRGLWLYVTDRCASTLGWLMQEQDKQIRLSLIEPELNALIRVSGSPLVNKKVGLFELTYKEHTHVYLDRATCCYWYKMDDGDYCSTCPHRTKEDRNAQLLKYMAEEYEKVLA